MRGSGRGAGNTRGHCGFCSEGLRMNACVRHAPGLKLCSQLSKEGRGPTKIEVRSLRQGELLQRRKAQVSACIVVLALLISRFRFAICNERTAAWEIGK